VTTNSNLPILRGLQEGDEGGLVAGGGAAATTKKSQRTSTTMATVGTKLGEKRKRRSKEGMIPAAVHMSPCFRK